MDNFLKIINGQGMMPDSDDPNFNEDDFEELGEGEEYDEEAFDDDVVYALGDMDFSAKYHALSAIDIEKFLEDADFPFEVKLDYEFSRNLKKLHKSIASDFDYTSYDGGRTASDSRKIDVNGFDFTLELELSRADDDAPFVLTARLTRV
jgi:hypothetical protein